MRRNQNADHQQINNRTKNEWGNFPTPQPNADNMQINNQTKDLWRLLFPSHIINLDCQNKYHI